MTHKEWTDELAASLDAQPDVPLVIEDEEGRRYEITDCSFENVDGTDQTLLVISRVSK